MNFAATPPSHDLVDLPNISFVLAEQLARIGASSLEDLKRTGAESVWIQLRKAGFAPGTHSLLALEGAIKGVPWQLLPLSRRQELLRFTNRADWLDGSREMIAK